MGVRQVTTALLPWVIRILIAAAALAAPIITYRAFTDDNTPDPQRQQRLHEVKEQNRVPANSNDSRR